MFLKGEFVKLKMPSMYIEGSAKTPMVDFNNLTGELILSGRSIPENAAKIYEQVLTWIKEYIQNAKPITNLRLNLEYFNTASSLWLAKIVQVLASIDNPDFTLCIHLYINIEDYNTMNGDEMEELLSPFISMLGEPTINVSIKIYATDDNGGIIKESMVLI